MPLPGDLELWLRVNSALFILYPIIPCRLTPHNQEKWRGGRDRILGDGLQLMIALGMPIYYKDEFKTQRIFTSLVGRLCDNSRW